MLDFLKELTRRKVWLFGGIYFALSWIVLQVSVVIEATLELPGWIDQITLVFLGLGFPVALLLAWAQESALAAPEAASDEKSSTRPAMSIAILPFINMSDERELGWVADGMSEDLTTRFSTHDLRRVAARESAFAWKEQSPDIREVGEVLGVSYVLEGSLRVIGDTIRVTAQLIDARTGDTIWAESYDHTKSNLAGIQDDIVDAIVAEAMAALTANEYDRIRKSSPDNLNELDICLLADDMSYFPVSIRGQAKALDLLEAARLRFPDSFEVLAELATHYANRSSYELDKRPEYKAKAEEALRKALKLNASSERVLMAAVVVLRQAERHDESLLHARKLKDQGAVIGGYILGNALVSHGKFGEARAEYERWLHLAGKRNFRRSAALTGLALSHMGAGDFGEAEELLRESLTLGPERGTQRLLLVALAYQGKTEEVARELEVIRAKPGSWSAAAHVAWLKRYYANDEFVAMQIEGMRLAGLE